jgi:pimeloyl-ACP methyl ester carboxylesterase
MGDELPASPEQSRWLKEMRHDPLATLAQVKAPTLVVYGSADPWVAGAAVGRAPGESGAPRHPNVETVVIAGPTTP